MLHLKAFSSKLSFSMEMRWREQKESQADRQDLAVLMAMVYVVQIWWIWTPYQSLNYESFYSKFGVGDNIVEFTNPTKFGWEQTNMVVKYRGRVPSNFKLTFCLFFLPLPYVQPIPMNWFSRTIAQKTWFEIRKCPLSKFFSNFWLFGVIILKNPTNFGGSRDVPAKIKKLNNSNTVEYGQNISMEHEYKLGVILSDFIIENYVRRPLAGIAPWRDFFFARKHQYLENTAW